MWAKFANLTRKYLGHVTTIIGRFMKRFSRRPIRPAILVSTLALLVLGVTFTVVYVRSNFTTVISAEIADTISGTSPGVVLLATMWALSPDSGTMSVSWSVSGGCGTDYTFGRNTSCVQNGLSVPMNLYLNLAPSSDWNSTVPVGFYDPMTISNPQPAYYIPGRQSIPTTSFDTVLPLDPFIPYTLNKKSTTLYYPFDIFQSYVSLVAINPTDNSTIPIAFADCYGTVVNLEASCGFEHQQPPGRDIQYSLTLILHRHPQVKALVIMLVLVSWTMSLAVLWMTIIVLFRQQIPSGLLLTSTTILFALPQIRGSMPDAPSFGAIIDIGCYLMNVCLVSICTSILLSTQLHRRDLSKIYPIPRSMEYSQIGASSRRKSDDWSLLTLPSRSD